MERLPPTLFGRTLRTLIRENWGTQARFAAEVSVDGSWITKLVRADQENLTFSSLQKLLAGFARPSDREQLYEAWLETYAPSPLDQVVPDPWSSDEQIIGYALSVHDLISAGKVLPTFRVLATLWERLRTMPDRTQATLEVGHALVDAANQLDRVLVSIEVVDEMRRVAVSAREPTWVGTSLWLASVALRNLRPRSLGRVERSLQVLRQYLGDWQPVSTQGRCARRQLDQLLGRDQVLAGLDAMMEHQVDGAVLEPRIEELRRRAGELESPSEIGLASEVLARALVATGRIEEAIEPLRLARANAYSTANRLKVQICRIQLLLADGRSDEAQRALDAAVDFADTYHLVHHRHKLATIQQALIERGSGR